MGHDEAASILDGPPCGACKHPVRSGQMLCLRCKQVYHEYCFHGGCVRPECRPSNRPRPEGKLAWGFCLGTLALVAGHLAPTGAVGKSSTFVPALLVGCVGAAITLSLGKQPLLVASRDYRLGRLSGWIVVAASLLVAVGVVRSVPPPGVEYVLVVLALGVVLAL
ncbi:MAG: hypothetical protein HY815_14320, partial [Candidatus Riflebacteria bacterium]|nr:hypothetical protein [Candidatus Riflebacteria bacterium]